MFSKGRLIGIGFGLFALICLVATYDYSRGRLPQTDSPLVADVLAATIARDCGRDATEIVSRYIPLGTEQAQAEHVLERVTIVPPKPWFWSPMIENSTAWDGVSLEALRTIKATAFGNNLLRIHLSFAEKKVKRIAAEVVCRFE
jgi:hypothetical protein